MMHRHLPGILLLLTFLSYRAAAAPKINTNSLPPGTVGAPYSATLSVSGAQGTVTWSVSAGSLPAGLALDASTGVIGGTPTTANSYSFTVMVDDGKATDNQTLSIRVDPPLVITTQSLPNGTVGTAYSHMLAATGGSGGYSWSLQSGALPAGLSLNSAGAISGTPRTAGASNFMVRVTDSDKRTADQALTLTIDPPPPTITTSSLPAGQVGVAYSQTLAASGGSGGYTWSLASGSLPAGLTLTAAGVISGTPTTVGASNFTVGVADSGGRTSSRPLSITIGPAPLTISTASLPNGTVGAAYSQNLDATGGTPPYQWLVTSGSLPPGLTMSLSGTISGTPTQAVDQTFTVRVVDSLAATTSKSLSIKVDPPALTITTASLPNATVGAAYSQTLAATGGSGGNTWSVASGSLPAGLNLSGAGAISGTPTAAGTSNFTVSVADNGGRSATKALTITVDPPGLSVTTASLPNATVGVAYSQTLDATGGSGGNTWSISAGSLPAGLSLSAAGAITGTPSAAGTSNFTAKVADNGGRSATKALSIRVDPPALTISTTSVPGGTVGAPYSFTLASTGGSGGNSWSLSSGSLPGGLTLAANGTISGRPTGAGTSNFTVQVKDSAGATATKALTMSVAASTLTITTQSLPAAVQGAAYNQPLAATGGSGGYRWSLEAGSLPDGLTLDPGGRIVGTATGASATFNIAVTDSSGVTVTKSLGISVTPPLSLPQTGALPSGVTGAAYTGSVGASGGQPPYTYSVTSGQLPPGLALDQRSGGISGRPTQVGSFTFAIQVRDAGGSQTQTSYTIAIANTLTVINPPMLPAGSIGVAYQATLTAAGGTAPYSWSATAGSLPGGLTFKPDGGIDGTPSDAGNFTFTATVTDAVGARANKEFTLAIAAALTITTGPQLPQGVPGVPYNASLAAAGGIPPYQWSITAGSLADGLRLDAASGAITGVPAAPSTASFSATVADSRGVSVQKAFTLTVAPGVTFTSPATLPAATAGEAYTFTLAAAGGRPPYTWRISSGDLPAGLALNAASGVISGTPSASGTFNFTIEATDAAGLKAARVHTLVVNLPSVTNLSISGVPATLGPLQQPQVEIVITNPYPVDIAGRLNLTFVPASGMPDDPAVQFSTGGRSAAFTIAANDTRAVFSVPRLLIQSGSVAGTIQFTVESLRAGASTLPTPSSPIGTAQVPAAAAVVRAVQVQRTSGGFNVAVSGATTTRELSRMVVRFRPTAGATLQTSELTIELTDAARGWFQSADSAQYGGQFMVTVPFSFVGGPSSIGSVAVVLSNSVGTSQEASGNY